MGYGTFATVRGRMELLRPSETRRGKTLLIERREHPGVPGWMHADAHGVPLLSELWLAPVDDEAARIGRLLDRVEQGARLELVLRHATTPAVRPDDVLRGLTQVSGLEAGSAPLLTRQAQGPLDPETGEVGDPLA